MCIRNKIKIYESFCMLFTAGGAMQALNVELKKKMFCFVFAIFDLVHAMEAIHALR